MATRMMTVLVRVDKPTLGLWPSMGVFQYNEVTPLRVLAGSGSKKQDPLSTRAFLSEGGKITVDGTALYSKSPWHETAPRKGDVYLLLDSVDIYGISEPSLYFRIEDGNIVPAPYPELEPLEKPLPLARVLAHLADLRKSEEIRLKGVPPTIGDIQP